MVFRFVYESQTELTSWKNALQNGISYALGDDKVFMKFITFVGLSVRVRLLLLLLL